MSLFDAREPFLSSLYLGVGALFVAACGRLSRVSTWALSCCLFLLLASLGRHAILFPLLTRLPVVGIFRYPAKCLIPTALLFGLLVSAGIEACLRPWDASERRRGVLVALLALGFSLLSLAAARLGPGFFGGSILAPGTASGIASASAILIRSASVGLLAAALLFLRARVRAAPSLLVAAIAFLVFADLLLAGRGVNPLAPRELASTLPEATRLMRPGSRTYLFQDDATWLNDHFVRGPVGWPRAAAWALGVDALLSPPVGGRFGFFGGFDGDFTGLAPRALSELSDLVYYARGSPLAVRILAAGSVDYVIALHDEPLPGLRPLGDVPSFFSEPIRVLEVSDPLPRAYVVGGARRTPARGMVGALLDRGFDMRREVVSASLDRPSPEDFSGEARIVERRGDFLSIDTKASAPGFLVVTEAFDAAWKARVDGVPSAIFAANGGFRGVEIPAGRHRVEMRYRPAGAAVGAAISATAIVLGLLAWEVLRRNASSKGSEIVGLLRRA